MPQSKNVDLVENRAHADGATLSRFAAHSASWPDDNFRVLGMYYTSRAWADDVRSAGWGQFVFEAYRDARAVFP